MARLVTDTAMQNLLQRIPDFHRTCDVVEWNSSSNFRMPVALRFEVA